LKPRSIINLAGPIAASASPRCPYCGLRIAPVVGQRKGTVLHPGIFVWSCRGDVCAWRGVPVAASGVRYG
jgi:hypothetical protein